MDGFRLKKKKTNFSKTKGKFDRSPNAKVKKLRRLDSSNDHHKLPKSPKCLLTESNKTLEMVAKAIKNESKNGSNSSYDQRHKVIDRASGWSKHSPKTSQHK